MVNVTLVRKISNASDRGQDRLYALDCQLPAVPRAGDCMRLPMEKRVDIDDVQFVPDKDRVIVHLHADHRNFKAGNKEEHFYNSWVGYQAGGWRRIKTTDDV